MMSASLCLVAFKWEVNVSTAAFTHSDYQAAGVAHDQIVYLSGALCLAGGAACRGIGWATIPVTPRMEAKPLLDPPLKSQFMPLLNPLWED